MALGGRARPRRGPVRDRAADRARGRPRRVRHAAHARGRHRAGRRGRPRRGAEQGASGPFPLTTLSAAAAALGIAPGSPPVYTPTTELRADAQLDVDVDAAAVLGRWFELTWSILEALGAPTLWPEHFDAAIDLGDEAAGTSRHVRRVARRRGTPGAVPVRDALGRHRRRPVLERRHIPRCEPHLQRSRLERATRSTRRATSTREDEAPWTVAEYLYDGRSCVRPLAFAAIAVHE